MAELIGPDFYRETASDGAPGSHHLIDTQDPAFQHIVQVCFQMSMRYDLDLGDPHIVQAAIRVGQRRYQEHLAQELAAKAESLPTGEVVYYMRLGNRVKIGYTSDLPGRMSAIQPEELLVTEPGGRALELVRHGQFAHLRVVGEWFKWAEPLVSHVRELLKQ